MKIKKLIKKYPPIWNFLKDIKDRFLRLSRLKDVIIMMALFHLFPEQIYRFSTRKMLPSKKNKFKIGKNYEPYKIIHEKTKMKKLGKINLVNTGFSFKINNIKKLKGKTFFTPGWEPLRLDNNGNIISFKRGWSENKSNYNQFNQNFKKKIKNKLKFFKKKDITYCIDRKESLEKYLKQGFYFFSTTHYFKRGKKILPISDYWESKSFKNLYKYRNFKTVALIENFSKSSHEKNLPNWTPSGSTIPTLFALAKYAKEINVYGWDYYFEKSPAKLSYWKVFMNLYDYKWDVFRSRNQFESGLYNYFFAYKFSKLPNVKIHSHLGSLNRHKSLIKKIEKVLFS